MGLGDIVNITFNEGGNRQENVIRQWEWTGIEMYNGHGHWTETERLMLLAIDNMTSLIQ